MDIRTIVLHILPENSGFFKTDFANPPGSLVVEWDKYSPGQTRALFPVQAS
jgi:hypothetical protein